MKSEDQNPPETKRGKLTQREQEVLKLVIEGKSNREIASLLVITHHTAKAHVSSIIKKLGVKTRVDVVIFAFKSRILED